MAHLGSRGRKEKRRQEVKTDKQEHRTQRKRRCVVCFAPRGRAVGVGKGEQSPRHSHLWEAKSEQAGFCSASAAGQQNWCSTVSFLRTEQRDKVRGGSAGGAQPARRHPCPENPLPPLAPPDLPTAAFPPSEHPYPAVGSSAQDFPLIPHYLLSL